ncbi:hypothetical protein [Falsirhodobacter halotolerans]|uniref:hypothetical protein n=1 Tax=Falsirhodobacter halotolerans TaxID=1146892 RepID=UPI001FD2F049|nr:hypothetical protein [Falsirhodobacter halotolerans]MCJ8138621.1 hypothetical protein [Falsirhodobacter halotolerans]
MDILTGRRAAERRAVRDRLELQADIAVAVVQAEADELRRKRDALQGVLDEFTERRRGRNDA